MRFLVVVAFLAGASAAPSQLLAPVAVPAPVVPVAYSALPTLSPGDVQAAAIDAQVKANDLAIAAADKARELNEQAIENIKQTSEDISDKTVDGLDAVKQYYDEAFWASKDKEWQALDAVKTAEAQLDGAIARDAPVLAKSTVVVNTPILPYVAGIAPVSPLVYTPGIVAPVLKSVEVKSEEAKVEIKSEEKNELVKSAEEKKEEKDSVVIEASTKNLEAKPQLAPVFAPLSIQPYYSQGYPLVAPVALASPVLKYTTYPQVGLAPAIVKTAW